jgi:fluoroquinolone transport system permease protein
VGRVNQVQGKRPKGVPVNRVLAMYAGELNRMKRYGITAASLFVAAIWIMIIQFSDVSDIRFVFPLTLFMDATLMSLLLAGVTMIFENQENTFRSMMVLPITRDDYLFGKSMAIVTSSLTTLGLLLVYGIGFKNLEVSILGVTGAVILVAFAFAQVGIVMTYYSEDFTDLLMNMFKVVIVFVLPTILEMVDILNVSWVKAIQYFNPTKNALVLLQASVIPTDRKDLVIAVAFLMAMAAGLYALSRKLLVQYAAKGGA